MKQIAFIGFGLIASSLARALRKTHPDVPLVAYDHDAAGLDYAKKAGLIDAGLVTAAQAAEGSGLVVLATPVGAFGSLARQIAPHLKPGAIVTDVGSVKQKVIEDVAPHIPEGVHFVPAHPVAGTEKSGPESGFAELFKGRWCILTPLKDAAPEPVLAVESLWTGAGMKVARMTPRHHDRVMAIVSHLPHLIAFSIVGTAARMEEDTKKEIIKYAAGGFRDFTRIAASSPEMWRDIFLNNSALVLETLEEYQSDLDALIRAVKEKDGGALAESFARSRDIRSRIVEAGQHQMETEKIKGGKQ